jgi:hypothetical protein
MTDTALAATLYGAEDLRMVERPLGTLEPGMVRIRFGAGGTAAPTCTTSGTRARATSS